MRKCLARYPIANACRGNVYVLCSGSPYTVVGFHLAPFRRSTPRCGPHRESVEVVGRGGSEPDRCHESVPGRSGDSAAHRNPEPQDDVGECTAAGSIIPENWLLGQFNLTCRKCIV